MSHHAFGFYQGLPLSDPASLQLITVPDEQPQPHDLLVQVAGFSINPVDTKRRQNAPATTTPQIVGYDAVGTVIARGAEVLDFAIGDRVLYAGTTRRAGSYQEQQLIDSRLVAKAPSALSDADAAALPLVSLTAWELLFEKMGFIPEADANVGKTLLVINGAGGVGSLLTQLANWAGLTVIATASPVNHDWLIAHGVALALDYHSNLETALAENNIQQVDGVTILYAPAPYFELACKLVAPFGHIATIVTPDRPLPVALLKDKAASFDLEYMFTKSDFSWEITSQGKILTRIAELAGTGKLNASVTRHYDTRTLESLRDATARSEAGHQAGKIVLTGPFAS
ncbi:zinc-binding alcohol dehydrogenase family protein [Lacticaseibacillus mingshuiensis]|uniref:Zinc-binding alcohol dehydrogenase family protein n=1 Tax=Lacticaseibacillus mingshuiensis TaxID=2799574 RepID=A0ABW4CGV9_9LACO|nr:zinc-binding alcohol dehydrogenase family protein [Lacticaseibacillus mingshuiensis]